MALPERQAPSGRHPVPVQANHVISPTSNDKAPIQSRPKRCARHQASFSPCLEPNFDTLSFCCRFASRHFVWTLPSQTCSMPRHNSTLTSGVSQTCICYPTTQSTSSTDLVNIYVREHPYTPSFLSRDPQLLQVFSNTPQPLCQTR
jgi:hypothetical protein